MNGFKINEVSDNLQQHGQCKKETINFIGFFFVLFIEVKAGQTDAREVNKIGPHHNKGNEEIVNEYSSSSNFNFVYFPLLDFTSEPQT